MGGYIQFKSPRLDDFSLIQSHKMFYIELLTYTLIMKKTIIFAGLLLMLALVSGCIQQQPTDEQPDSTTSIEFTFANEAKFDTTITVFIDREKVYEKKMISYATTRGYFGQEFEYKTLEVPDQKFTLKVVESATGLEETTPINPANGKYVSVTFWTEKFIIRQTEEKQIRID